MTRVQVSDFDKTVGMEVYSTQTPGAGGYLRQKIEDFIVQEIGLDGTIAPLKPTDQKFPDQRGKFTAFFLIKRNIDTIQAVRHLSRRMGINYKRFSYAGIKDRRAITSQMVTVYRVAPHDLLGRDSPNITILHPHRVPKPLVPGSLWGNQFTIITRDLKVTAQEVANQIEKTKEEYHELGGMLNFYGPQRFGIPHPTSHIVGKQLVHGDLEAAVQLILNKTTVNAEEKEKRSSEEPLPSATPRARVRKKPAYYDYEQAIRQYLIKHPGDFAGSLKILPRDLPRLYIHAYQSYLFNKTISERLNQEIPLQQPTIGDFIMSSTGEIHSVRMVTQETLSNAKKGIQEGQKTLVVPIIGYDFTNIQFKGPIGKILNQLLTKEKLSPDQFRLPHLPVLSSRGTFRPLLVAPKDFHYKLHEKEQVPYVRMKFSLPKGSYASVVLREFIKPEAATQL